MYSKKSIKAIFFAFVMGFIFIQLSCSDRKSLKTGSDTEENSDTDCLAGLPESQKAIICKLVAYLKDTSKISTKTAIGFPSFRDKKDVNDFIYATAVNQYTQDYISNFFTVLDLTEIPLTGAGGAEDLYRNYVTDKCDLLEKNRPTVSGKETKSILVSIDSLYKLVNALYVYQQQTNRKTGVRVVFANHDNVPGTDPKTGQLTFFLVGTMDTTISPPSVFKWQFQKDLTILSTSWGVPGWGQLAYNHGELCPNSCGGLEENTKYNK